MTSSESNRLDRLELITDSIVRSLENLLKAQESQHVMIQRLTDGQLALQSNAGVMAQIIIETREETRQLKRGLDYLLSQDGERG
jgi:hypothetical protein